MLRVLISNDNRGQVNMLFFKRTIYDRDLNAAANEILAHSNGQGELNDEIEVFSEFLNILVEEVDKHILKFKVIIPYRFMPFLKGLPRDIIKRISLKVDFKGNDATAKEIIEQLTLEGYQYTIDIKDRQALSQLPPNAEFYILDNLFVSLLGEELLHFVDVGKLIVKNINDYEHLEPLRSLNINYFSGDFIAKPKSLNNETVSANKLSVMHLLTTLNDPDVELGEVPQIITADTILSYKLLRIVNSPLFRGVSELTSVQDAIVRFGYVNLKKWGLMLSLCSIKDKPNELSKITLERAIMCSRTAELMNIGDKDMCYTAGLFSTLDAFFDSPMEKLLGDISLNDQIRGSILGFEGDAGEILKKVINYQRGLLTSGNEEMTRIYIESNKEANETLQLIGVTNSKKK